MNTYALASEGMTDVAVIERIIEGCFGVQAQLNPILPIRDATDRSRAQTDTFSNWELVLEFLSSKEPIKILENNDFLIVQIDTDQANHPNFGLDIHNQGSIKSIDEIVMSCRDLLLNRLSTDFPEEWKNRILFALPVLSTECWLVPIFDESHSHSTKTLNNCDSRLAAKMKISLVKEYKQYSAACKVFSKKKHLDKIAKRVRCLAMFLEALAASTK